MSADLSAGGVSLPPHEQMLLRLFRCMTDDEQSNALMNAVATLGQRWSLDPGFKRSTPEERAEELTGDLMERLRRVCPLGGWPGQQTVDLDCTGDPGFWLEDALGSEPVDYFCRVPFDDDETVGDLACDYLSTIREQDYPVPSDFGYDPAGPNDWTEEDEDMVRGEFLAFLSHWRERVVTTLERQRASGTGE